MGIAICKRGHLIHADGFYKDGSCKLCRNTRSRRWKKGNQEKMRIYGKEYHRANAEKRNAYSRSWYAANKEKCADWMVTWRLANPEKIRANSRKVRDKITNSYICASCFRLKVSDVPQEVIELKRQHIILKRELKKWKQSQL